MKFCVNHDLHCHSTLSSCCADPAMSVDAIWQRACREQLETQCITDHLWDSAVPGASPWYEPQNIEHVCQNREKIRAIREANEAPRLLFGCETEYCGEAPDGHF